MIRLRGCNHKKYNNTKKIISNAKTGPCANRDRQVTFRRMIPQFINIVSSSGSLRNRNMFSMAVILYPKSDHCTGANTKEGVIFIWQKGVRKTWQNLVILL